MRLLITNDDGILAPGILALAGAFSERDFDVWVVAPDRERSATGHAITIHHPLRADEVDLPGLGHKAIQVDGTPADCVKLGIECLMPKRPDLVISGINRGANMGIDVLYSGTVSAALEGIILGVPSIAISLTSWSSTDFTAAAEFARQLAIESIHKGHPPDTILNVNVPPIAPSEIAGVTITRLGERRYQNRFERRQDPRGRNYYWLTGDELPDQLEDHETDIGAVANKNISVTPVHFDLTHHRVIPGIREWALDFKLIDDWRK